MRHFILTGMLIICTLMIKAQPLLTLEAAIDTAIHHSPDILTSELSMTISEENLKAQEAALKSNFSFQVTPFNYSQVREFNDLYAQWNTNESRRSYGEFIVSQPIKFSDGTISLRNQLEYQNVYSEFSDTRTKGFSNNLYVVLTQPLFTYNRIKMEVDRLKLDLENATLSYAIRRMYLEMQVTEYYYNVYQRKMALKIAEDEYENQKQSTDIIRSKVEADLSPREELYQAELNMSTSESNLQNAQVDLENAKDQFKQYIGMALSNDFDVQADVEYKLVTVQLNKAIQNGLDTRMELQQKEISLENSYYDLTVAKATNEFKGNVDVSMGLFGENPHLGNVYETPTRSPQVAVTFSIPIWDWGQRKSRIKAAEANVRIREIDLSNERSNIELAIRQSYRRLKNLTLQIQIARQNVKNAQLTYEINLERYKNGDLTSMDLQLFQNQLSEKKINLSNSLINYKLELLNMKIQSLWDFENNTSFVPVSLQNNLIKKAENK